MCILHFILKFKLHMYNRIEDFMLTIGWWQNYQSQSKKFRSDERALVSITPYYRQLMRSRRIETAVLPELQGFEPSNKRGTIISLKKT